VAPRRTAAARTTARPAATRRPAGRGSEDTAVVAVVEPVAGEAPKVEAGDPTAGGTADAGGD
jgi:hypothetical protein